MTCSVKSSVFNKPFSYIKTDRTSVPLCGKFSLLADHPGPTPFTVCNAKKRSKKAADFCATGPCVQFRRFQNA